MIKIFIAEDSQKTRIQAEKILLKNFTDIAIVASCETFAEAEVALENVEPSILILEIELEKGKYAFDLLSKYKNEDVQIIFVAAFEHYALKAISFSCCDYILKPYTEKDFVAAVNKALKRLFEKENFNRIQLLLHNLNSLNAGNRMIALPNLKNSKEYEVTPISNILYAESKQDHTSKIIALKDKSINQYFETILSQGIGEITEKFADVETFARVHYQYLVNTRHIANYNKRDNLVLMANGKTIPVSREKKQMLQKMLSIY